MTSCTFAGHREVYQREVRESVYKRVEALMDLDDCFVFYCGGMGEFDAICAGVVRSIKKAHKDRRMQNAGGES